jgi:hypothetical protein
MGFLLYNDKKLDDFVKFSEIIDFSKNKIHPLYAHMQKDLDGPTKAMLSARINKLDMATPMDLIPEDYKNKGPEDQSKNMHTILDALRKKKQGVLEEFNSYIPGHMDHVTKDGISSKLFYQRFLSRNRPVFVIEGSSDWPAMTIWDSQDYLVRQTKETQGMNQEWDFKHQTAELVTEQTD